MGVLRSNNKVIGELSLSYYLIAYYRNKYVYYNLVDYKLNGVDFHIMIVDQLNSSTRSTCTVAFCSLQCCVVTAMVHRVDMITITSVSH